jgi:hypothetical protein
MRVSSPYVPTVLRLQLDPTAVNTPIAPRVAITFRAQAVDQAGEPVQRAGIPVYFHEVSRLASDHSNRTFAIVNCGRIGGHAVEATTNAQGIARFVVTGTGVSLEPIYFQAYLFDRAFGVPYSLSQIVPVVFAASSSSP